MVTRYFPRLSTVTKAIHCLSCKLQQLFMFCSSFFKLLIWDFPHVTLMYNLYFLKMLLTNQTNFFCFQFDLHEKLQKRFHSITFVSHTSINKSLQKSWIYLLHSQNLESLDEVGISWWHWGILVFLSGNFINLYSKLHMAVLFNYNMFHFSA